METVTETGYGTGGIPDIYDKRDLQWGKHIGMAGEPFDWEKGYDIEKELQEVLEDPSFKLPVNDQNGSSSCGGQAQSKKGEVVSALVNRSFKRKSAKYPYAQVFVPPGGSWGRDLCNIAIKQGFGNEEDTSSYEAGKPPTEPFMQRKSDITEEAKKNAGKDKAFAYAEVPFSIDAIAQAIKDTKGVIIGICGQNNGTWRTAFPKPPTETEWRHWVYAGKAKLINGKKYIGFLNSWSENTGEKGWQWIGEDYINDKGLFNIWTMVYNVWGETKLFDRVLRFRNKGDDVKKLQQILGVYADGIFGPKTLRAVQVFQLFHGLKDDGIVGPKTQAELIKLVK